MKTLKQLVLRSRELSKVKKVLEKMSGNYTSRDLTKALLNYEKHVNRKDYRSHVTLRMFVEEKYQSYIKELRNSKSISNETFKKYMNIFQKYKLP